MSAGEGERERGVGGERGVMGEKIRVVRDESGSSQEA